MILGRFAFTGAQVTPARVGVQVSDQAPIPQADDVCLALGTQVVVDRALRLRLAPGRVEDEQTGVDGGVEGALGIDAPQLAAGGRLRLTPGELENLARNLRFAQHGEGGGPFIEPGDHFQQHRFGDIEIAGSGQRVDPGPAV